MTRIPTIAAAIAVSAVTAAPACAADHVVQMKNKGSAGFMVFEPAFVAIKPGDTVTFKATDKGHDAVSIPGLVPAGGTPVNGKISQDTTVAFTKPGVYGIKCTPHFGMGMVALIQVGKATNLADAKTTIATLPPLARKNLTGLIAQVH